MLIVLEPWMLYALSYPVFWLLGSFGSNVFYVVLNKNVGRQC